MLKTTRTHCALTTWLIFSTIGLVLIQSNAIITANSLLDMRSPYRRYTIYQGAWRPNTYDRRYAFQRLPLSKPILIGWRRGERKRYGGKGKSKWNNNQQQWNRYKLLRYCRSFYAAFFTQSIVFLSFCRWVAARLSLHAALDHAPVKLVGLLWEWVGASRQRWCDDAVVLWLCCPSKSPASSICMYVFGRDTCWPGGLEQGHAWVGGNVWLS